MTRAVTQTVEYTLGATFYQSSNRVIVADVTEGSTAKNIGLCAEAIILFVNHNAINTLSDFNASFASIQPGETGVIIAKMQNGAISFFSIKKD